jgi:hypothetical protein
MDVVVVLLPPCWRSVAPLLLGLVRAFELVFLGDGVLGFRGRRSTPSLDRDPVIPVKVISDVDAAFEDRWRRTRRIDAAARNA